MLIDPFILQSYLMGIPSIRSLLTSSVVCGEAHDVAKRAFKSSTAMWKNLAFLSELMIVRLNTL